MSASYKPALLKALVRLVRRGAATSIGLREIGHEFVALYWVQTVVFRLRQAPTLARETGVVSRIRAAAERTKVRDLTELAVHDRARLDKHITSLLPVVLDAFHVGKPESFGALFSWRRGDARIEIGAEAHRFLTDHAIAIEAIANLWWARYLERVNALAPLIIEKVERDGARRRSVVRYVRILAEIDGNRCFYCETDLTLARKTHVDHVIPWSFMLADPSWNLVLACDACNLAKSDTLPNRTFVEKLDRLHVVRSRTVTHASVSPLVLPGELDRYYEAALSVEWPSGWSPIRMPG